MDATRIWPLKGQKASRRQMEQETKSVRKWIFGHGCVVGQCSLLMKGGRKQNYRGIKMDAKGQKMQISA